MGAVPSRWVTSGYFRVHLWVVMGLATFASLAVYTQHASFGAARFSPRTLVVLGTLLAATAYVGAVVWMYEASRLGKTLLGAAAAIALAAGWGAQAKPASADFEWLRVADWCTASAQLGFVTAAMFLGHWYLNWPGMKLDPLRLLVRLLGAAIGLRSAVALIGLALTVTYSPPEIRTTAWWCFLVFRYCAGLAGPAVFAGMTWQTLKIPNTQSATGILYAGVILTFLGELTSQLISHVNRFPL
jgi:hypothetical protein